MPLTCGARSTVNVDRSTVNFDRSTVNTDQVRTGPIGPGYGLDLGWAQPTMWHAVAQPRHDLGPPLGCGLWLVVHGGIRSAGPWTAGRSTVDRVHPLSLLAWLTCTESRRVRSARGGLCFRPRRAPTGDMVAGAILRRRWRSIKVGKNFPRPWRTRWWGLGGGRGFPERRPRRSVAWSWRCAPAR